MRVKLVKMESKSKRTKCGCCGEMIPTCQQYTQVVNADTGRNVGGERYGPCCEEYAVVNWEAELICEDNADDGDLASREEYAAYQAAGCASLYWGDRDAGFAR